MTAANKENRIPEGYPPPDGAEVLAAAMKHGALMEQRVARTVQAEGFATITNWAFQDSDTGKSRELDVFATWATEDPGARVQATARLLIECKGAQNPIVVVTRKQDRIPKEDSCKEFRTLSTLPDVPNLPTKGDETSPALEQLKGSGHFFHRLGLADAHHARASRTVGASVLQLNLQGGDWVADPGRQLFDSVQLPLAKAVEFCRSQPAVEPTPVPALRAVMIFPIVVVRAELFEVDTTKTDRPAILREWVPTLRRFDFSSFSGTFRIDYVQERSLGQYLKQTVRPFVQTIDEKLKWYRDVVDGRETTSPSQGFPYDWRNG